MNRTFVVASGVLFVATLAGTSVAHDPFEITSVARVEAAALTLEVTMARSTARRLVAGKDGAREPFVRENVAQRLAELERLAPSLFELTADGRPLRSHRASARLTSENDMLVGVVYERPTGTRLTLVASHLRRLPEGYTSALSVTQGGAATARFKLLVATDPAFEVPLRDVPVAPDASGVRAIVPSRGQRWLVVAFGSVLLALTGMFWFFRRPA